MCLARLWHYSYLSLKQYIHIFLLKNILRPLIETGITDQGLDRLPGIHPEDSFGIKLRMIRKKVIMGRVLQDDPLDGYSGSGIVKKAFYGKSAAGDKSSIHKDLPGYIDGNL